MGGMVLAVTPPATGVPVRVAAIPVVVDPDATVGVVIYLAAGIVLGTASGLTPGLHANTFALLLASAAPSLPGPAGYIAVAMVAAGVVHTFLDVVPAVALGVPDAAMAATALPAHRLVIEGRGREALRLSALGSGLAVVLAIPLAIPVTAGMVRIYPHLQPRIPLVLTALAVLMVATEPSRRGRVAAAGLFMASAALGLATLDRTPTGLVGVGGLLAPLFAGLFGAPVLADALGGGGVPIQDDARLVMGRRRVAVVASAGAGAGAIVGYLPGVSSAIAAAVVLMAMPAAAGARGFIVATSGVNTANAVFALFTLVALGTPRTGVLVALDRAGAPLNLPLLLAGIAVAAAIGFCLVPIIGDRYLRWAGHVDYRRLSVVLLVGLAGLSVGFAGAVGLVAFLPAAGLGLLPPRVGTRRVHLMGVLIGPLILGG